MTLLWLPTRVSQLNPLDSLCGQGKDVSSLNNQDDTIEEQVARFVSQVKDLSNQQALQQSGVLSTKF